MLSTPDFKQKQIVLALLSHGDKLNFKNDNIIIKSRNGDIKLQSTCYRLFALFIVGHVTITSGLLQRAQKFGFSLILMGHNLTVYGQFNNKTEGNVLLRKKQYIYSETRIAQHLIMNKIAQQQAVLKHLRRKDEKICTAILQLQNYQDQLPSANIDLQSLLGLEGSAARVYFQQLFEKIDWHGRKPRAKQDPANTLLDIGYTLLFNFMEGLLNLYGFDLYQGVYHQQFYQRKSLVCDLVEPFRPIIDSRIRKAFSLGQVNTDDFDVIQNQYRLFGEKSRRYMTWLLEEIMTHKQEMFLYVQQYYRCFMRQKPIDEYPVFDKFSGTSC